MQLEDEIAKELAGIIKDQIAPVRTSLIDSVIAIEKRLNAMETKEQDDDAPADVTDEIAKAIALLAEAPPLMQASSNPVVVNFSPPNTGKKIKTITTRRDEAGNLVARVIED